MNQQTIFEPGTKVKFNFKGNNVYGTVKRVNKKSISVITNAGRFRVTPNALILVNESEWNLYSHILINVDETFKDIQYIYSFKAGDQVSFVYKGKVHFGNIKRINRKTITVQGKTGIFRINLNLLIFGNSSNPELIINTKKNRKWSKEQKSDYKLSNSSNIDLPPKGVLLNAHLSITNLAKALNNGNDSKINIFSNEIASILVKFYKLPPVKVHTGGKRKIRHRNQMLGVHRIRDLDKDTQRSSISVFSRTAKREHYVKPKTFLRTFIHEFIHHFDLFNLKIKYEYHTKGFYQRVNTLYDQLKTPLENNSR